MDQAMRQRLGMTALGGAAGLSLYGLTEILTSGQLTGRMALLLFAFALSFFISALALAGAMRMARALVLALAVAGPVAGLLGLASLRFIQAKDIFDAPALVLAASFLGLVPLPFVIAWHSGNWRDYPALFTAAWTIVVRYAAAWLFVGVVWLVIMLSNSVFQTIGLEIIKTLLEIDVTPWLITGAVLGLAMAVVTELADLIAPDLVLRLLRLLVPVVLGVLVIFILALPFKGLSGLVSGFSTGGMLLLMVALCTTLISVVVDRDATEAAHSRLLRGSARAMALLIFVPAVLAAVAVGQRVIQYGWTPDRITAAVLTVIALGYGGAYAVAALQKRVWMARIRQTNIILALLSLGFAALSLSPLLNAQAISAHDQTARLLDKRSKIDKTAIWNLKDLGVAGEAALADLAARASEPGQEVLAAQLAAQAKEDAEDDLRDAVPDSKADLIAALNAEMPLQPPSATAVRAEVFAAQNQYSLREWLVSCRTLLSTGAPGCAFVAGDFLPQTAEDEAIIFLGPNRSPEYFAFIEGEMRGRMGGVLGREDAYIALTEAEIIAAQQAVTFVPVPLNALVLHGRSLVILP